MKRNNRNLCIDIIKGIGIFLMVYRHCRGPFSEIVLLFHMAIFFIASGYLYDGKKCETLSNVCNYTKRKIKGLWFPYVCANVLFLLLNNFFVSVSIYTDNIKFLQHTELEYVKVSQMLGLEDVIIRSFKCGLLLEDTQLGGALWFLRTLLIVSISYGAIDYILRNKSRKLLYQGVFSCLLLIISYFLSKFDISLHGFSNVFSTFFLYWLGVLIKKKNLMEHMYEKHIQMVLFFASVLSIFIGYNVGYISIVDNKICNPLYFVWMSLSGWFFLYIVANYIQIRFKKIGILFSIFSIYSIWIVIFHFLSFKLITQLIIWKYGLEQYMLAAFPVLNTNGFWWFFYLIVGIGIPIVLGIFYTKIKRAMILYLDERKRLKNREEL